MFTRPSLATPCAQPGCGHSYNWHVPRPRCAASLPGGAPCPCSDFQAQPATTQESPVPDTDQEQQ